MGELLFKLLCKLFLIAKCKSKIFRFNYYELNDLSTDLSNLLYYFFVTNQYDGKIEGILALARGSHDKYEFFGKVAELKKIYDIQ